SLMVVALIAYLPTCSAFLGRIVSAPFRIAADAVDFAGNVAGTVTDTALGVATLGFYQGDYYGYPCRMVNCTPAPVRYAYAAPAPVYVQPCAQQCYVTSPATYVAAPQATPTVAPV